MANLAQEHPYLFKRVRLKAIMHTMIGLVLAFVPSINLDQNITNINATVGKHTLWFGLVYILIGVLISIGLFLSKRNYGFARKAMMVAFIYNLFWCLIYVAIYVQHPSKGVAYIAVLYLYLTYNLFLIFSDPGWRAIEIVKDYREEKQISKNNAASLRGSSDILRGMTEDARSHNKTSR